MTEMHTSDTDSVSLNGRSYSVGTTPSSGQQTASRSVVSGPQDTFRYRVLKRSMDVLAILVASPIFLVVVAAIAVAIRVGSPGPIFFSHRRIRGHGAFFTMWKFRTMCVNSNEVLEDYLVRDPEARAEWRKTHKLKQDPRVTRVGEFLRKTSLDELPQLWNVLTGSMSLVGPRPIVAAEVEKYGEYFADYCKVKPGITGLWQISGRSACTYPERVQMDRQYADHWSLAGDVRILVKTLPSVINQVGAY